MGQHRDLFAVLNSVFHDLEVFVGDEPIRLYRTLR